MVTDVSTPLSPARLHAIRDYVARTAGSTSRTDMLRALLAEIDRLAENRAPNVLTVQQLRVVIGLARGETVIETARRLALSPDTVRTHRRRLFRRLRVHNGAHAVAIAFANGWITRHDLVTPGGNS